MSRIGKLFERLRAEQQRGLIAYITAGDPTPDRTPSLIAALERGGADLIELGVPFSDPVADGPVIQLASDRAIAQGTNLKRVLDIARQVRETSNIPLLLFSYLNPLLRYGFDALSNDAVNAGIDGCLITDLSVEEASDYVGRMRGAGLDTVFLAAPTSTERRLKLVAEYSTGFIYLVSRTGVTGVQQTLSASAQPLVEAMRQVTSLPLAVGFGISRPEHAAEAGKVADAIVVGSAFVRIIEQAGGGAELEHQLESLARELKSALERVAV
ncbi:MAG: tryptophan synthase subunit alpha [Bryobacterales bacterium]|nr:tryptophan synthase subunit alpha [Bryobacterales bacterium]